MSTQSNAGLTGEGISREEQVDRILNRGVIVGVLPDIKSFRERLLSDKPMKIYIGADPTSTSLHLSHAKNYMLMEEFRKLGHEAIILFGDFTARIWDPTGRSTKRNQLTKEDVNQNVQDWIKQIRPLMDFDAKINPPRIVYNNDWLSKLTMEDVINLSSNFTVQQMLERDMFEKRMREEQPIFLHEFMYPLMQGYDSVALEVDAELCGTDQTFNALVGRTLSKKLIEKDKFVVTVNLMENPITHELMSKSLGTGIFLNLDAFNMYGSIMAKPDEMIEIFFINNTRVPLDEVRRIVDSGDPRAAKMRVSYEITKIFHGEEAAIEAQNRFIKLVQNKEMDEENVPKIQVSEKSLTLLDLLKACLPNETNSELRRLVGQNAVKVNDEVSGVFDEVITIPSDGLFLKVGKKKWFKVVSE